MMTMRAWRDIRGWNIQVDRCSLLLHGTLTPLQGPHHPCPYIIVVILIILIMNANILILRTTLTLSTILALTLSTILALTLSTILALGKTRKSIYCVRACLESASAPAHHCMPTLTSMIIWHWNQDGLKQLISILILVNFIVWGLAWNLHLPLPTVGSPPWYQIQPNHQIHISSHLHLGICICPCPQWAAHQSTAWPLWYILKSSYLYIFTSSYMLNVHTIIYLIFVISLPEDQGYESHECVYI